MVDGRAINPFETDHPAYREWVGKRIRLARSYFQVGKLYFYRAHNLRHRLAGLAYIARFEWLLARIEAEGCLLRPEYHERKSLLTGLKMAWLTLTSMVEAPRGGVVSLPVTSQRESEAG